MYVKRHITYAQCHKLLMRKYIQIVSITEMLLK